MFTCYCTKAPCTPVVSFGMLLTLGERGKWEEGKIGGEKVHDIWQGFSTTTQLTSWGWIVLGWSGEGLSSAL